MWDQIRAIAWAQFRTVRNHLPRTSFGTVLMGLLTLIWYGSFAAFAVALAIWLPVLPLDVIKISLAPALLGMFLFWQVVPLFTLTGGWSLQLGKLQVYPISTNAFFGIETLLRVTTSVEMLFLLLGTCVGLVQHQDIRWWWPLCLLLYIPFNLFISLSIRELLLHSFQRNRLRELFAILIVSVGVLPQLFLRTELGAKSKPYWIALSNGRGAPWSEVAALSCGNASVLAIAGLLLWIAGAFALARWQFGKSLTEEETLRPAHPSRPIGVTSGFDRIFGVPAAMFRDPVGALLEKELRSMVRMPRVRVVLGLACVFSVVVFFPVALGKGSSRFMQDNFLPIVNLYGLLILGDALLWNIFGFDRSAAQAYFVTPVAIADVLRAKNIAAVIFILIQMIAVLAFVLLIRVHVSGIAAAQAIAASCVGSVYFISIGNLSSVSMARAVDPRQTMRKQTGGQIQLWMLGCSLGISVLIGFAFLARWALQSDWALIGVLAVEFAVGLIVYRIALESAAERAERDRERILAALSKFTSPISA